MLYRMASSTYFNVSILTSDFWGLCFGKFRSPMELATVALTAPPIGLGLYVRICSHGISSAKPISRGTNRIGCTSSRTWSYWVASWCTFGTLPVSLILSSTATANQERFAAEEGIYDPKPPPYVTTLSARKQADPDIPTV